MTTVYDVEKGDAVHPGDPVKVDRYTVGARINCSSPYPASLCSTPACSS